MSGGLLMTFNVTSLNSTSTLLQSQQIDGQTIILWMKVVSGGYTLNLGLNSGSAFITTSTLAFNTEHTVGISYSSTGTIAMTLDGTQTGTSQSYLNYFPNFASTPSLINSNSIAFNGYIDQLLLFNAPPSIVTPPPTTNNLNTLSANPTSVASALGTITNGSSILPSHLETVTSNLVTSAFATGSFLANSITVYSDGTTTNSSVSGRGIQIGDMIVGLNVPSNAMVNAISNSGTVYYTSATGSGNSLNFSNLSSKEVVAFVHPTNYSTTSNAQTTGNTLGVSSTSGVEIGDNVYGLGIPASTTVSSFINANTISISNSITIAASIPLNTPINFVHPSNTQNLIAQTSTSSGIGASTLTLFSTAGIQVGDIVTGANLSSQAVTGLSGNTITLSSPIGSAVQAGNSLNFFHALSPSGISPGVGGSYPFTTLIQSNSGVLNVSNTTGVIAGDYLFSATGVIAGNFQVQSVGSTSLTLNSNNPPNLSSSTLVLSHPDVLVLNANLSASSTTLNFNSTPTVNGFPGSSTLTGNGVMVGDFITGNNIPSGDKVVSVGSNSLVLSIAPSVSMSWASPVTLIHPAAPNIQLITINSTSTGSNTSFVPGDIIKISYPNSSNDSSGSYATSAIYTVQNSDLGVGGNSSAQTCANVVTSILNQFPTLGVFNLIPGPLSNTIELVPNQVSLATSGQYPVVTVQSIDSAGIDENNVTDYFNFSNLSNASNVLGTNGSSSMLGQANFYYANSSPALSITSTTYSGALSNGLNGSTVLHGPVYAQLSSFASPQTVLATGSGTGSTITVSSLSSGSILVGDIVNDNSNPSFISNCSVSSINGGIITLLGNISSSFNSDSLTFTHSPSTTSGLSETFYIYADPGYANSTSLNSLGFTLTVPNSTGTVTNITSLLSGTIAQQNITSDASNNYATFQWASVNGITDFSQPVASVTLTTPAMSPAVSPGIFATVSNASFNNVSINNSFFKPVGSNLATTVQAFLNPQVYSLTGHVYIQYNNNSTNPTTYFSATQNQTTMPGTDIDYVVQSAPYYVNDTNQSQYTYLNLNLNTYTAPFSQVTATSPSANLNLDIVASTTTKGAYSFVIDVPSNASNVVFTPNPAFAVTTNSSSGHLVTISGQYTPPLNSASSQPILGTLNTNLNNTFNAGGQFTIDSVITPNSNPTALNSTNVQSLYFGATETNSNGQYNISNLPAGQMTLYPLNNASMANYSAININDAMAAMSIAAGLGVPQGLGKSSSTTVLPSDFISSDWNKDGTVTAADVLGILNYYVSVNKSPTALSFSYFPAQNNSLSNSPESVANVVVPAISTFQTNLSNMVVNATGVVAGDYVYGGSNSISLSTGNAQTLDIVGVLNGNVVSY